MTPDSHSSGALPLYFISNLGQVDEKVMFYARTPAYTLWLTHEGLVFDRIKQRPVTGDQQPVSNSTYSPFSPKSQKRNVEGRTSNVELFRDVSRLLFINAYPAPEIIPVEESGLKVNYFKGNDPSRWVCDIPTASAVLYKNVYDRIDIKVYGLDRCIEYDWRIRPGGNPADIRFQYKNAMTSRLESNGDLRIMTTGGEFLHKKPVCFQEFPRSGGDGGLVRHSVSATFKKFDDNVYGFEVGPYDRSRQLVIDPVVLAYSTYLGGNQWEEGASLAVDNSGYTYITGCTWSTNFPVRDQYQVDPGSDNYDVFVSKIDSYAKGQSSLIYSTYLGGADSDGTGGIATDGKGNVYITGNTFSDDFPTKNAHTSSPQGWGDVFVTKLDTTKSGSAGLVYSTYLGGTEEDNGLDIAADSKGNAYVTGWTYSLDFPTRNPYFVKTEVVYTDGFMVKLDTTKSGSSGLIYSTYLGGKESDGCKRIILDSSGSVYITGWTFSSNFPTKNAYLTYRGYADAFVTRIDPSRSGAASLLYSTFLGGSNSDYGEGIAVDPANDNYVYVTGLTRSTNFPAKNAYQGNQDGDDAFVTKLDTGKSGSAALLYSTYLGGAGADKGYGIAAHPDTAGMVYITGLTGSSDFPTLNPYQAANQGGTDAFVTRLDTLLSGSACLLYSTYLGGSKADSGDSIAVDNNGNVHLTGWTLSTNFPTLNRFQADPGDTDYDAFLVRFLVEPDIPPEPPAISLSRERFDFSAVAGGVHSSEQSFVIANSGGGELQWTAAASAAWLVLTPGSGTGDAVVTVTVETAALAAGSYTGTITVSDPEADNSPQTIDVYLTVYASGATGLPFGQFATPVDGSAVSSSIPVTGWALDDIGVAGVKIYLGDSPPLAYLGDTVFIEGARPDIETAYPGFPQNYKAGWGYMLLTNFLPNGGSGTYTLQAVAVDIEGQEVSLGKSTIIVDNANAVKPFGAIDSPAQGGIASGSSFTNVGWVLTPQPNTIPADGSTISVWVDGVNLGHPTYNLYRSDIASLFPGYNNSNGAGGYFKFDSTKYTTGIHTILWTAADNAGNADGIGSRYFMIQNTGSQSGVSGQASVNCATNARRAIKSFDQTFSKGGRRPQPIKDGASESAKPSGLEQKLVFSANFVNPLVKVWPPAGLSEGARAACPEAVKVITGFDTGQTPRKINPDQDGRLTLAIRELERLEIRLPGVCCGYLDTGSGLKPLPPGSTLDTGSGVFYWQPGPGFVGIYRLVFYGKGLESNITIIIKPGGLF